MANELRVDTGMGTVTRTPLIRRTAWGAIFAGTFVALACQLLLTTLGLAIGAATVNPAQESGAAASGVGIFAGIWMLVSSLISLFIGGLVTAWLAGFPRWVDGMLHGLVVWGLTAALTTWLITTGASSVVGGAMGALQTAMVSPTANQAAQDFANESQQGGQDMMQQIRQKSRELLASPEPGGSPIGVDQETQQLLDQSLGQKQSFTQADKDQAIQQLVDQKDLDRQKAQEIVDDYVAFKQGTLTQKMEQERQQGKILASPEQRRLERAGQQTANVVTNAAIWTFFAMLLGLCAAALGGAIGRPSYLVEDERRVVI